MSRLTHIRDDGRAAIVDTSDKAPTRRVATAKGRLRCAADILAKVRVGDTPKGSVIQTAEPAGIMAVTRIADLIPLCHPLPLTKVVAAEVGTLGVTRVEMEALTAPSVACLTMFDMLKAVDRTMTIQNVRGTAKRGSGKSGDREGDGAV